MGSKELYDSLIDISRKIKQRPEMAEGGVTRIFSASRFFESLGYKDIDIRSQERLKRGGKIPDFECLDDFEQSIFVLELKKPSDEKVRSLESYRDGQLKDRYVIPKRSRYGVLSNGIKFYLYKRYDTRLTEVLKVEDLSAISESDAQTIYSSFKKPSYEYTDLAQILEELRKIDPKPLREEENRETFYEIFRLKQEESGLPTKFTRLVLSLMNLFDELLTNGEKSEFLDGAYLFWKQSYAHKPSKVPESWSRIQNIGKKPDEETLYKFMFCLETAHNIVSKLILAKVCEDAGLRNVSSLKKLEAYMNLKFGEGRVNYIAYPFAIKETFDSLRAYLVSSLFEDDIFDWWKDCEIRVGKDVSDWRTRSNYKIEQFGDALARIFFALRSFDFSDVPEDILGELYQHYFDPETRKALGEFYTPIEVVEYILDAVDYKGNKILNQRLLDPACGSGAFVVEALKRYLHAVEKHISRTGREDLWPVMLRDLCERPKIIGFDINPFARLMAQMRFMMEIIPFYLKAQKSDSNFVLTTIPIFRTDSLEIETKTGRFQKQLGEFAGDIRFSMRLPVIRKEPKEEAKEGQFIPITFRIPTWEKFKGIITNKDSYFLLLKNSFEVIKDLARKDKWEVDRETLKKGYENRFDDAGTLAGKMRDYVNPLLGQIYVLRKEYSDGRLIKTIEDLVLAGILKNYFLYDYVVGNPPYVNIKGIPEEKRELYKNDYNSAYGRTDLYILFIEAGIKWLNKEGLLGFITSNKFILAENGRKIRKFITDNCKIDQIIDFGDSGVFADATNYPSILIFKQSEDRSKKILICNVKRPKEHILKDINTDIKSLNFVTTDYYQLFQINQPKNEESPWRLLPKKVTEFMDKLDGNATTLRAATDSIREAVASGADSVFIVDTKTIEDNRLEEQLTLPFVFGEDVRKWSIYWRGLFLIYPYIEQEGKKKKADMSDYPNTEKYLAQFKDTLTKRYCVKKGGKDYFEHHDPSFPSVTTQEKIVTPDISDKNHFAYDDEGLCYKNTCYVIVPKKSINVKSLCGILNSNVLEFYFKQISPFLSGKYYRYKTQYLERLPIHLPKNNSEQKLADEITERVEKILSLTKKEQRIKNFPGPYFDELLDEIEEWSVVKWKPKRNYKEVKITVEKDSDQDSALVFGKDDRLIEPAIDSEVTIQYVIESLKGKSVKKGVELIVKLPRSDAVINKILEKYKEDKITLLETPIRGLEKEINERVYKLYGLDEDDIKVIDEFLEKF